MPEQSGGQDRMGRIAELMARTRYDPERLAAVKRAMTGKTRCPECDEVNPANQERCDKCGASLYPRHHDKKEI